MPLFAALERFFERLFERQSARLFHTQLQPIQLQRRIEKTMESDRVRDGDRTRVPNRYAVHLHPDELTVLRERHPSLAADLADSALAFARGHGYVLADRPTVGLVADTTVQRGDVRVVASGRPLVAGPADLAAPDDERESAEHTAVFVIPEVDAPAATLREIRPDGSSRTFAVDGRPVTIGRAPDNGLVLGDTRASRHHARLHSRRGALLFVDLGSTNGSWINDHRVEEMVLGVGDRIRIGDTVLVVESVDEA